jgi:hypothetical protein
MRYATAAAFRAALEHRLHQTATSRENPSIGRLRRMVVFERLLARLLVVAPDRWIVKGGVALELRLGSRARTTRDLDLALHNTVDAATADLIAAQALDLGDFFVFAIELVGERDGADRRPAVRYDVAAELAGRRFDKVTVDVNLGDPQVAVPDRLRGPNLLGFAGFEPINVLALPLELHLAEKVHAYTRTYGGGRRSSRVKDLVDLILIRSTAAFTAGRLRQAIDVTFGARGTPAVPSAFPTSPPEWAAHFRELTVGVGLDPDLSVGHGMVATFLDPILNGSISDNQSWDPIRGCWNPTSDP